MNIGWRGAAEKTREEIWSGLERVDWQDQHKQELQRLRRTDGSIPTHLIPLRSFMAVRAATIPMNQRSILKLPTIAPHGLTYRHRSGGTR